MLGKAQLLEYLRLYEDPLSPEDLRDCFDSLSFLPSDPLFESFTVHLLRQGPITSASLINLLYTESNVATDELQRWKRDVLVDRNLREVVTVVRAKIADKTFDAVLPQEFERHFGVEHPFKPVVADEVEGQIGDFYRQCEVYDLEEIERMIE